MATIQELERRIAALETWKAERERQQITYPLDQNSVEVLNKYFLRMNGFLDFTNVSGGEFRNILLKQDSRVFPVSAWYSLTLFTANPSNDEITTGNDIANLKRGRFENDNRVRIISSGSPPGGLVESSLYYVVNANTDGTVFELSLSLGGSPVNITSSGTGEHYITYA